MCECVCVRVCVCACVCVCEQICSRTVLVPHQIFSLIVHGPVIAILAGELLMACSRATLNHRVVVTAGKLLLFPILISGGGASSEFLSNYLKMAAESILGFTRPANEAPLRRRLFLLLFF